MTTTPATYLSLNFTPEEAKAIENAIVSSMKLGPMRDAIEAKFEAAYAERDRINAAAQRAAEAAAERDKVHYSPRGWEIHLSPHVERFTARYGRKIKAAGGDYSHCRGHASHRFVHLPNTEEGRKILNALMQDCRFDCVIAKGISGRNVPAWVTVISRRDLRTCNVRSTCEKLRRNIDAAVERGIIPAENVVN